MRGSLSAIEVCATTKSREISDDLLPAVARLLGETMRAIWSDSKPVVRYNHIIFEHISDMDLEQLLKRAIGKTARYIYLEWLSWEVITVIRKWDKK